MSFKSEMYKSSEKKPLVDEKESKEAVMDGNHQANRTSLSLTNVLKNDSDLYPAKDRRSSNTSDSSRICRCAQMKLLKEKTKERIRFSQESNRSSAGLRVSATDRRLTKEEVYAGIFDNDINADCMTNDPYMCTKESCILPSNMKIRISNFPEKLYAAGDVPMEQYDDIDEFHKKEQERVHAKRSSKESRYTEIFDNDVNGCEFTPLGRCKSLMDVRVCQGKRPSKERRYTEIFDNDVNGCAYDDFENVEIKESDTKSPSKGKRYTEIFDNDILGYHEEISEFVKPSSLHKNMDSFNSIESLPKIHKRHSKEELIQNIRFGNSEDSQKIDGSYRSSKEHRYTQIFDNDINGYVEPLNVMHISVGTRTNLQETEPQRSSKEKRYTQLFDNDMFGFVDEITTTASEAAAARNHDESFPKIGQKLTESSATSQRFSSVFEDDESMTSQNIGHSERPSISMSYKMCTESCTSHLKPHRCSIKVNSNTSSTATSQSNAKIQNDNSLQQNYEADDEGSTTNVKITSKSKTSKSGDHPRTCACSRRFPELFNKDSTK